MAKKQLVDCPRGCGAKLELVPHPTKENRVIAYCNCLRKRYEGVVEQNAIPVDKQPAKLVVEEGDE